MSTMTSTASQPVTDRQLAASVRLGRKITVTNPNLSAVPLTGYVSGWDEKSIFLAVPCEDGTIRKLLVNRDFIAGIELHDASTMATEPPAIRPKLNDLIS